MINDWKCFDYYYNVKNTKISFSHFWVSWSPTSFLKISEGSVNIMSRVLNDTSMERSWWVLWHNRSQALLFTFLRVLIPPPFLKYPKASSIWNLQYWMINQWKVLMCTTIVHRPKFDFSIFRSSSPSSSQNSQQFSKVSILGSYIILQAYGTIWTSLS